VALTSTVLRNMRSIKMMGMTPDIAATIRDSRTHELNRSAHFRWFVAFMNLFGTLPKLLSAALHLPSSPFLLNSFPKAA
jgi:hypothetical protein